MPFAGQIYALKSLKHLVLPVMASASSIINDALSVIGDAGADSYLVQIVDQVNVGHILNRRSSGAYHFMHLFVMKTVKV